MLSFQEPGYTRFDLRFNIAGIPVRVHPLFWLMALLFGGISGNLLILLVWVPLVFISILVHELGHAFTMRFFGQPARVTLYLGGGLATPDSWGFGSALTANEQIIVLLAGPGAGFLFAGLTLGIIAALGGSVGLGFLYGFLPFPSVALPLSIQFLGLVIGIILWVNIFWGFINLVPTYPLDGGQVARLLWLKFDRWDGIRKSLWLSIIAGAIMALLGFGAMQNLYIGALFAMLAFQNYQMLQMRY